MNLLGWRISIKTKEQRDISRYLRNKSDERYKRYPFREFNEGYLIYKKSLKPWIRKTLNFLRLIIKWLIDKRAENVFVNKKILVEMGLPEYTDLGTLDAFYKKEFRKKKYIRFFGGKFPKNLPEPPHFLFEYIPRKEKFSNKKSNTDFFKTFEK